MCVIIKTYSISEKNDEIKERKALIRRKENGRRE